MKYPKAFEKWWSNKQSDVGLYVDGWIYSRIKRLAYNAWKAGRKYEKEKHLGMPETW